MTSVEMKRLYHKHSASNTYIVGFIRDGKVYYMTVNWNQLKKMLKEDRASSSRGGYLSLRVYVSADVQRKALADGTAKVLCDANQLAMGNMGDAFEKACVEILTGNVWAKDRHAFYETGDMELNGEQVQVKLSTATLTNENIIKNMVKKLGK